MFSRQKRLRASLRAAERPLRVARRTARAGFTLIEAVVALALLAVFLAVLGPLIGSSAHGVRSLEQHLALLETARLVATSVPSRDQLAAGELAGDMAGLRWRVAVSPFFGGDTATVTDSRWMPQTVVLRVQSPSGGMVSIETVRLQRKPGQ
jgi:general secretion pathway protein I